MFKFYVVNVITETGEIPALQYGEDCGQPVPVVFFCKPEDAPRRLIDYCERSGVAAGKDQLILRELVPVFEASELRV